jgi:hypothetical protein
MPSWQGLLRRAQLGLVAAWAAEVASGRENAFDRPATSAAQLARTPGMSLMTPDVGAGAARYLFKSRLTS